MEAILSDPIRELNDRVLHECVKNMDIETQEEVLNNYATCLDCRMRFFKERGINPSANCRFCAYQNYKLF